MKLYDLDLSGNCYKARLFASLARIPVEIVPVDFLAGAQAGDQMPVWNRGQQTKATGAPAQGPGHVGGCPGFVESGRAVAGVRFYFIENAVPFDGGLTKRLIPLAPGTTNR